MCPYNLVQSHFCVQYIQWLSDRLRVQLLLAVERMWRDRSAVVSCSCISAVCDHHKLGTSYVLDRFVTNMNERGYVQLILYYYIFRGLPNNVAPVN